MLAQPRSFPSAARARAGHRGRPRASRGRIVQPHRNVLSHPVGSLRTWPPDRRSSWWPTASRPGRRSGPPSPPPSRVTRWRRSPSPSRPPTRAWPCAGPSAGPAGFVNVHFTALGPGRRAARRARSRRGRQATARRPAARRGGLRDPRRRSRAARRLRRPSVHRTALAATFRDLRDAPAAARSCARSTKVGAPLSVVALYDGLPRPDRRLLRRSRPRPRGRRPRSPATPDGSPTSAMSWCTSPRSSPPPRKRSSPRSPRPAASPCCSGSPATSRSTMRSRTASPPASLRPCVPASSRRRPSTDLFGFVLAEAPVGTERPLGPRPRGRGARGRPPRRRARRARPPAPSHRGRRTRRPAVRSLVPEVFDAAGHPVERRDPATARRHHRRACAARPARARRPRLRPRRRRRVARVGTDRRSGRRPPSTPPVPTSCRARPGSSAARTQWRERLDRHAANIEIGSPTPLRRRTRMAASTRSSVTSRRCAGCARSSPSSSWTCNRPTPDVVRVRRVGRRRSSTATSAARAAVRRGPTQSSRRHARCGPSSTSLGALDAFGAPVDLARFRRAVVSALDTPCRARRPLRHRRVRRDAPARPTPATSTSCTSLGAVEGAFPPRGREDPLLPDRDRHGVPGLVQHRERRDEERHEYLAALASAPERIICFARADSRAQRRLLPSRWLLETARALHGSELSAEGLRAAVEPQRWLEVVESFEHGVGGDAEPGSPVEYDLRSLLSWLDKGRSVGRHPLASGELGAGFDAVFARASRGVHPLRRLRRGPGRGRRRRPHRLPDVARDVGDVPVPVPARQRPAHPRGAASRGDGDDQRARRGLARARDPRGVPPPRAAGAPGPTSPGTTTTARRMRAIVGSTLRRRRAPRHHRPRRRLAARPPPHRRDGRALPRRRHQRPRHLRGGPRRLRPRARVRHRGQAAGRGPARRRAHRSGSAAASTGSTCRPTVNASSSTTTRPAVRATYEAIDGRIEADPVAGGRKLQLPVYALAAEQHHTSPRRAAYYWFTRPDDRFATRRLSRPTTAATASPRRSRRSRTASGAAASPRCPANRTWIPVADGDTFDNCRDCDVRPPVPGRTRVGVAAQGRRRRDRAVPATLDRGGDEADATTRRSTRDRRTGRRGRARAHSLVARRRACSSRPARAPARRARSSTGSSSSCPPGSSSCATSPRSRSPKRQRAELRDRIRSGLEAVADGRGDPTPTAVEGRQRCAAALDQVDEAALTTLHGFAFRILSEHPPRGGPAAGLRAARRHHRQDRVRAALGRVRRRAVRRPRARATCCSPGSLLGQRVDAAPRGRRASCTTATTASDLRRLRRSRCPELDASPVVAALDEALAHRLTRAATTTTCLRSTSTMWPPLAHMFATTHTTGSTSSNGSTSDSPSGSTFSHGKPTNWGGEIEDGQGRVPGRTVGSNRDSRRAATGRARRADRARRQRFVCDVRSGAPAHRPARVPRPARARPRRPPHRPGGSRPQSRDRYPTPAARRVPGHRPAADPDRGVCSPARGRPRCRREALDRRRHRARRARRRRRPEAVDLPLPPRRPPRCTTTPSTSSASNRSRSSRTSGRSPRSSRS